MTVRCVVRALNQKPAVQIGMKGNDAGLPVERHAESFIAAAFNSIERNADMVGAQMIGGQALFSNR
ncbi:hypothetical protein WI75_25495 [Burkholderia ubonensis]|nr:hypothetical protein WI75_25495 [Burkholderia ubonensis]